LLSVFLKCVGTPDCLLSIFFLNEHIVF
jgi:hypothetical protein